MKIIFYFRDIKGVVLVSALLFLLLTGTGCSIHSPRPMEASELPPFFTTQMALPDHFTGRAVLTLPDSIPPGGSLQLVCAVSRNQGLRLVALSPMGSPLFEMAATPQSAEIRETETGSLTRLRSLESLTQKALGIPLDMEEIAHLLAGKIPLPRWTAVIQETPGVFLLKEGWHVRARILLGQDGTFLRLERLHRNRLVYSLTPLTDNPRTWAIENKDHLLKMRIRSITPVPELPPASFRLHEAG